MKIRTACFRCMKLLPLAAILAVTPARSGQDASPIGAPDDWTHRHAIFSNPGTLAEAVQDGRYAEWARIVTDPRFMLQQRKRAAAAASRVEPNLTLPPPETETDTEEGPEETEPPREPATVQNHSVRGVMPAIALGDEKEPPHARGFHKRPHHKPGRNRLSTDWSVNMGTGATLGMGVFPAKFSFGISTANCASAPSPDFVVYGTSLAGSGTQASIAAFDNLYSGCPLTVPTVFWAYNTGGTIVTSVALSLDGSQVAFVQSSAGGVASLVLLKWKAGTGTLGAPFVPAPVAPAAYRACIAPCMTSIPFSGGTNDTGSSVFPEYGADMIFVGDNVGMLHEFTGVFAGTPAEAGAPFPVTVSTEALSSPVFDPGTGKVFVGDYLISGAANCSVVTGACGFLYSVNASTGVVVQSTRLDFVFGLVDGPVLDGAAARVYAFVGADSGFSSVTSPCGSRVPCSGVFQFPTNFTAAATGTEARTGVGFEFMFAGTFDNKYFTSANHASPTGNLYVVGNTGGANNTLYQIPIASNVMGVPVAGPVISANFTNGFFAGGMSLTELFSNAHDYIFTSALIFGGPAACGVGSLTNGCVMGFDVTSGTIGLGTLPTGATASAGGVSAIIIDNVVTALPGASNIYYTPLADQACTTGGTGGCAIQISQASP